MKIRVTKPRGVMWYSNHIGYECHVTYINSDVYWVREPAGYLNFIHKEDCLVIEDISGKKLKIKACSNPVLWYNSELGKTFDITWQNDSAFWVNHPSCMNAWVYKKDVEVFNEV